MWTTRDGITLRLPHASLHTILSRLEPDALRRLAGGALAGDPGARVHRAVGRLAGAARATGQTAGALPVFAAPGYRLLVRPKGPAEGEILLVRTVGGAEEEIYGRSDPKAFRQKNHRKYRVRGARVTIDWSPDAYMIGRRGTRTGLVSLPAQRPVGGGGGVYVVVNGNRPVYVGEADHFLSRWDDRCRVIDELGLQVSFSPYRVFLGTIQGANVPTHTSKGEPIPLARRMPMVRKDVEHVLIREVARALKKRGEPPLNNESSFAQVWGAPAGVAVLNTVNGRPGSPLPSYIAPAIGIQADEIFELGRLGGDE